MQSELHKEDYLLTFEGKGIRPLMGEIVSAGYVPPDSIVFCHDDVYEQYYAVRQVEKMGEAGKAFFARPEATRITIDALDAAFKEAERFSRRLEEPSPLSLREVDASFSMLVRMNELYAAFDFAHTDRAFKELAGDSVVAANLAFVAAHKNGLREKYNRLLFEPESLFSRMLRRVSAQFSVPLDDLSWYVRADVVRLFAGITLSNERIAERKECCVFRKLGAALVITDGEAAAAYCKEFSRDGTVSTDVIRGVTAHKTGAIVRGKAYVLDTNYRDFDELKQRMKNMPEGAILVAPTTAPEHMSALRKAAAVVVDMGGMLSHTAIVSRELGIPSVIAMRYGSKVIKTGDELEVDAENGVVRILHRATTR